MKTDINIWVKTIGQLDSTMILFQLTNSANETILKSSVL